MFLSYIMSKRGETGKGITGKEWERRWELSGLIAVRLDKKVAPLYGGASSL